MLFLLSVVVGTIIARQQFLGISRRGVIQWDIFRLLIKTVLFALISGVILHQANRINSIGLYLYLISTGVSIGFFMTFERILKKYWISVVVIAITAGLVCAIIMNYRTGQLINGSFIVGIAPGIGYLLWGFIKKQWALKREEYESDD